MKIPVGIALFFFLLSCKHPPFSVNYRDKLGRPQGKWKMYYPSSKNLLEKGRYRNGRHVGVVKHYYEDGKIMEIEDFRTRGKILTTFYYRNGKVDLKGEAVLQQSGDTSIYSWFGPWQKYDSLGNHIEERTYIRGQLIWIRKMSGDSLMKK